MAWVQEYLTKHGSKHPSYVLEKAEECCCCSLSAFSDRRGTVLSVLCVSSPFSPNTNQQSCNYTLIKFSVSMMGTVLTHRA
ncbi:hypothetical protein BDA96_03G366500 [Sorghum bicolor]|uniref:Uncharacterized protein n=1 Tax=Sorghum bicolor TaxID=4558 RepID=A0A921UQW4_SORBI|nr:hypothetical protein BDA96_03G366500 [Sorghum bicolor]